MAKPRPILLSTLKLKLSTLKLKLSTLELKPKCLCGCSETRSMVGGNTSRLGSVVPAASPARLLEAPRLFAVGSLRAPVPESPVHHDPIPI